MNVVHELTIADRDWLSGGDDDDHLTAIIVINRTFHHIEAIRVVEDEGDIQRAASSEFGDRLDAMYAIGGEGPFDTVSIRGATYVLVMTPFQ